jgi:tRNA (guanine37-N1)-methyltransferase
MRIDILTLFPEMFAPLKESIIGRAKNSGKVEIEIIDIRDYTLDKHKKCDDYPFGGGAGMLMMPQPIADAIDAVDPNHEALRIYMSPKGKVLTQDHAKELKENYERLIILCGHYEGIDQRVLDEIVDEEISIGDYVLTGGELPACILVDCVSRLIDGVLAAPDCYENESIASGLLEYPQYTRPYEFHGVKVPDILLSGHHANIAKWREEQSLKLTAEKRPDLLECKK